MPDASYLPYFELHLYDEGFVIQMPEKDAPTVVPPFRPQHKLFQVLKESTKWGDIQNIETVGALNDKITNGDIQDMILVQEAMQEKKIAEIAEMIANKSDIKFVLIAGPVFFRKNNLFASAFDSAAGERTCSASNRRRQLFC